MLHCIKDLNVVKRGQFMLENSQILELVESAKRGDKEAKGRLLEENSHLIKSVIKRFKDKGVEYDDLYQIGCMGFLKAIKNFNASFNVKFSTYVVPMVIGEVKRFMRDDGSIKVSRALKTLNMQINKYVASLGGREVTVFELAEHFGVEEQEIVLAMEASHRPVSLSSPLDDGDNSTSIAERIECEDDAGDKMLNNLALKELVNGLEERDRKIIMLRYFFDKTQSEIAKKLNISQVQVSRLENKILENLKNKFNA